MGDKTIPNAAPPAGVYVLIGGAQSGNYTGTVAERRGSGNDDNAPLQEPRVVWSNHDDYFADERWLARPSITTAMQGGAVGLDAFFATGADAHFQFVRVINPQPAFTRCRSIDALNNTLETPYYYPIHLSEHDTFEVVTFAKTQDHWATSTKPLTAAQAFALILTQPQQSKRWLWDTEFHVLQVQPPQQADAPCTAFTPAADNLWIDGAELIDFAHAIYEVVLPQLGDAKNRAAVERSVERALTHAGDSNTIPLTAVGAAESVLIRTAVQIAEKSTAQIKQQLMSELSAVSIAASNLPTLSANEIRPTQLSDLAELMPEQLFNAVDGLVRAVQATIPREGPPKPVRELLDEYLLPLHTRARAWAATHNLILRTARHLRAQPTGPLTLMGLGAKPRVGGFLAALGQVVVDLPTTPTANGVELNIKALAQANTASVGTQELTRDWNIVRAEWKREGRLDVQSPALPQSIQLGGLRFGTTVVPLTAARSVSVSQSLTDTLTAALQPIAAHPAFGKSYLAALANNGVRAITIVPPNYLHQRLQAEGAALARAGDALFEKDPQRAIALFKAAATKFTYTPSGMYSPSERRIFLSSALFESNDDSLRAVFQHELAHADEFVRTRSGLLSSATLQTIDAAQLAFMHTDQETVSHHPEVEALSPSAPEERRADGLAYYWSDSEKLSSIDPDLHRYFTALTRGYQTKTIVSHVDGEKMTQQGDRLVLPPRPFAKSTGNLALWTAQRPYLNDSIFPCLVRAGDADNWADLASQQGCSMLLQKNPAPDEKN